MYRIIHKYQIIILPPTQQASWPGREELEFFKLHDTTLRLFRTGSYWDNVRYFNRFPPLLKNSSYQQDRIDLFMSKAITTSSFNEYIIN